ncbi:MAG TPA: addiction module protein [Planctomycetota bacterium]|nr:addiction module protein [Planctomycetota bacterium]
MLTKQVRDQLFNLPITERRKIAEELLDSADAEELPPELKAELDRAIEEYERDPQGGVSLDEFVKEMRAKESQARAKQ